MTTATQPTYEELVTILSNGISHSSLYFASHPKVRAWADEFTRKFRLVLEGDEKEAFFLGVAEGRLVHEGHYMIGPSLLAGRLLEFTARLNCGGLLFRDKVETRELCELFKLSAEIKEATTGLGESRGMLKARGIENIEVSPAYSDPGWFGQFLYDGEESWGGHVVDQEGMDRAIPIYQSLFDSVERAHGRANSDSEIDVDGARTVSQRLVQAADEGLHDVLQLVRYPDYDSYTVGHSVRVALLAVVVGQRLGMPPELLTELGTAGLLHDVGKAKIPHEILFKPARLDDEERKIMSRHPCLGAQILLENRQASRLAVGAAWGHHLRHDRKGYPETPSWAPMARVTKLFQVCDVFEALTAIRPYKPALTPRKAYEIMLRDEGAFDPGAMRAFVSAMGLYPPGCLVGLTNGELAVVVSATPHPALPVVQVTRAADGSPVSSADAPMLDLSAPASEVRVAHLMQADGAALGLSKKPQETAAEEESAPEEPRVALPELDFGCGA